MQELYDKSPFAWTISLLLRKFQIGTREESLPDSLYIIVPSPFEKVIFLKIDLWLSISYEAKNRAFGLFQVDSVIVSVHRPYASLPFDTRDWQGKP